MRDVRRPRRVEEPGAPHLVVPAEGPLPQRRLREHDLRALFAQCLEEILALPGVRRGEIVHPVDIDQRPLLLSQGRQDVRLYDLRERMAVDLS